MGTVTADNLKIYQCATWTEGSTHGGAIDTGNEIASSGDQVIFDDVTNDERVAGDTEYRKIFFRNENTDTISIKCWIESNYSAVNQTITITKGIGEDVQTDADDYTYVAPTSIVHADVLDLGELAQNASASVWIKRVVSEAGDGYSADSFQLGFGMY